MHNLRQKLNLVAVPLFYLPFPVAVLVYVRFLLSKYSFSQISVLFCRAWSEHQRLVTEVDLLPVGVRKARV